MKMQTIQSCYRKGESHQLAYTEWGDPDNPRLLFCAHGLSRNSRDFDFLAAAMADRYHVVCPDYPGRGRSESLLRHEDYENLNYLIDSQNLLRYLDKESVDWVGTSMGGIVGMLMASEENTPIRSLVLNDVGCHIPKSALLEIARYLRSEPLFENKAQARHYFESTYVGFGPLSPEHIDHLTLHGIWPLETGGYRLSCDPAIIHRFVNSDIEDVDLSSWWDRIRIPVLAIRGAHSKLLSAEGINAMAQSRDSISKVEFPRCAHAPSLMLPEHIQTIRHWLATPGA